MSDATEATAIDPPESPDAAPDKAEAKVDAAETPADSKPAKTAKAKLADPPADLLQRLEAAMMTTDRPIPAAKLAELMGGIGAKVVKAAIDDLNVAYEKTERSFRIEEVAAGYQIMTLPKYADVLSAMHKTRATQKLGPAAMETLAIVAYKQPILRADVEAIRGVACGEVLRGLMDRHMVKIVGRAEVLGRPILYGTTKLFLETFGLANLNDLPESEHLLAKPS